MASPFPGMDPYLEQAIFLPEFHSRLIVAIADALAPSLLPQYYVAVETCTYTDSPHGELLVGIPGAVVLSMPEPSAPANLETYTAGVATTVRNQRPLGNFIAGISLVALKHPTKGRIHNHQHHLWRPHFADKIPPAVKLNAICKFSAITNQNPLPSMAFITISLLAKFSVLKFCG